MLHNPFPTSLTTQGLAPIKHYHGHNAFYQNTWNVLSLTMETKKPDEDITVAKRLEQASSISSTPIIRACSTSQSS